MKKFRAAMLVGYIGVFSIGAQPGLNGTFLNDFAQQIFK